MHLLGYYAMFVLALFSTPIARLACQVMVVPLKIVTPVFSSKVNKEEKLRQAVRNMDVVSVIVGTIATPA